MACKEEEDDSQPMEQREQKSSLLELCRLAACAEPCQSMTEEAPSRHLAFRRASQTDRINDARHLNDKLQPKSVFNKIEEDPFLSTQ